jgi:hypothetical protein
MAWVWTCLSCNRTWDKTSPAAHRCDVAGDETSATPEQLRAFWVAILRWSPLLRGKGDEQIRTLISKPINRAMLVELLGASWDPAGDDGARIPINAPRNLAT